MKSLANDFFKELIDYNTAEWRGQAVCNGMDPNMFFTDTGDGEQDKSRMAIALDACNRCSVTEECLSFAIKNGIKHGIYGGRTYSKYRRGWVSQIDKNQEIRRK
jgi:WhiB family redox-sensing transcriptional regulator